MTSVVFDTDPAVFAAEVVPLLSADEAANGLMLGIAEWMVRAGLPDGGLLLRVQDAVGTTCAAGLRAPPHNLVLSAANADQVEAIVAALRERAIAFPGINGPAETAAMFVAAWRHATGRDPVHRVDEILYRLDRVIPRARAPGSMRQAGKADLATVCNWVDAFINEALPNDPLPRAERDAIANHRVKAGQIFLWERGGMPVGIAGFAEGRGARITNVYTPPHLRGQGIATALVGALSEALLARGKKFCFLYVDAANPVSAHVYENIGYRRVCAMTHIDYERAV